MPRRRVSVRLHCGQHTFNPCAANSCSQKVRARKPRSSSRRSRLISQTPGSVVLANFIVLLWRQGTESTTDGHRWTQIRSQDEAFPSPISLTLQVRVFQVLLHLCSSLFICGSPLPFCGSDHGYCGNGNDELTAVVAIGLLLRKDLLGEIPRQQQGVIGLRLGEPLRRDDRQVGARGQPALFIGAAIRDKVYHFSSQPEEIQQRAALGRSPVSGDRFALRLQIVQKRPQATPELQDTVGEALVIGQGGEPFLPLFPEQRCDQWLFAVLAGYACEQAQRAAMDLQPFRGKDGEVMPLE